jgi:hypothetical protein
MKIRINKETYINNPCPKISKEMWDKFYSSLYYSFSKANHKFIKKIETMDIRINQAYKGSIHIHFYITINKGLNDEMEFHMDSLYFEERFDDNDRYWWMVDFIRIGEIDLGTNKPMERYDRYRELCKLKSNTRSRVSQLVEQYKRYIILKEKFGSYENY